MTSLTLDELVNDYGATVDVQETWYGYDFNISIGGTLAKSYPLPDDQPDHDFQITMGNKGLGIIAAASPAEWEYDYYEMENDT